MDVIRRAFIAKWGKVPVLVTYRQMAIRQAKRKDWHACSWWCERGLELYGADAAREDAVEDLLKRRSRASAKIEELHPRAPRKVPVTATATVEEPPPSTSTVNATSSR